MAGPPDCASIASTRSAANTPGQARGRLIEHRLTKPNHPWTNGQVERMNRTIKDATVKRYHYDRHQQLATHLQLFIDAYNHARRLKTLRGLTPYEYVAPHLDRRPDALQS